MWTYEMVSSKLWFFLIYLKNYDGVLTKINLFAYNALCNEYGANCKRNYILIASTYKRNMDEIWNTARYLLLLYYTVWSPNFYSPKFSIIKFIRWSVFIILIPRRRDADKKIFTSTLRLPSDMATRQLVI